MMGLFLMPARGTRVLAGAGGRLCARGVAQDYDSMTLKLGRADRERAGRLSGSRVTKYVTRTRQDFASDRHWRVRIC
jgi:hypothetical protein